MAYFVGKYAEHDNFNYCSTYMGYLDMPIYLSAKSYTHASLCDGIGLHCTQVKLLEMIQMSLH